MAKQLDITTENCTVEKDGQVMIVTLNRPEKKNALTPAMLIGMYRAWKLLGDDAGLICGILTGKGDTFCAGMDLKVGPEGGDDTEEIQRLLQDIPNLHWRSLLRDNRPDKPIFLAVEGYAVAGGTEILQGTDIRVAAEDATFGITEVTRGLYPLGGSGVRLRRQIPYCLAAEMLLFGHHITAQKALEWGLINRIVPKGKALEETVKWAHELCENAPLSIQALTRTLRDLQECMPEDEAMAKQDEIGWPIFSTEDSREGMKAFREKRKAVYKGR